MAEVRGTSDDGRRGPSWSLVLHVGFVKHSVCGLYEYQALRFRLLEIDVRWITPPSFRLAPVPGRAGDDLERNEIKMQFRSSARPEWNPVL